MNPNQKVMEKLRRMEMILDGLTVHTMSDVGAVLVSPDMKNSVFISNHYGDGETGVAVISDIRAFPEIDTGVMEWTGTFLRGHYYIYGYDCDDVTDESHIVAEIPDDGNIYNVYVLEKTVLFIALIY